MYLLINSVSGEGYSSPTVEVINWRMVNDIILNGGFTGADWEMVDVSSSDYSDSFGDGCKVIMDGFIQDGDDDDCDYYRQMIVEVPEETVIRISEPNTYKSFSDAFSALEAFKDDTESIEDESEYADYLRGDSAGWHTADGYVAWFHE